MKKDTRLKALKELKKEFEVIAKMSSWFHIYHLLGSDFIPNEMDLYEINNSNYSKSIIDGWTSHVEKSKHYSFYVEMMKTSNNKVVSEWVKKEHEKKDLLIKLYEILK